MIIFLKLSFFSLFLMAAPKSAQVDVAAKAVRAKEMAEMERQESLPDMGARNVVYRVNPYITTLGLNTCRTNPFAKALGASSDSDTT